MIQLPDGRRRTRTNARDIVVNIPWLTTLTNDMKPSRILKTLCLAASLGACAYAAGGAPNYQIDASWPGVLPNNWTIGQVGGLAMGAQDHLFVIHRPKSIGKDQLMAGNNPPGAECCVAAPTIVAFNPQGEVIASFPAPETD